MFCKLVIISQRNRSKISHREREEKREVRKRKREMEMEREVGGRLSTTLETSPESTLLQLSVVMTRELQCSLYQPGT